MDRWFLVHAYERAQLISLHGEFDVTGVERFREALRVVASPGAWVVLDLTELTFVDASGVGAFSEAADAVGGSGRVILCGLLEGSPVATALSIAGITDHPGIQIGLAPAAGAHPHEVRPAALSG
jgi:anti-anti-sigma factor